MCGPRIAIAIVCSTEPNTLCARPPFVFFSEVEVAAARTSGLVNLVLSRQTGFFRVRTAGFNGQPMVINDHAVASTQLIGMGSKLYPSKIPPMLNKDLTRSMQNHSGPEQAKKGSVDRVYA